MHETIQTLISERPVLIDGAWGTELQKRGLGPGDSPELLNVNDPGAVSAVAAAYVEAGSRIIITNTFGGSSFVLDRHGAGDRVTEINRAGAEISRKAAGDRASVFASMGPTGKMLLTGEVTEDQLYESFREQARALASGGADAIVVETMSDLQEALIALRAAKETGLPVAVSMTYDSGPDNDRTMMGTTVTDATAALEAAGADVIGSNCGQGIEGFVNISRQIRAATSLPIWIKGNAGVPEMVDGKTVFPYTAERFSTYARPILDAGADFIGGCCGTSPEFIRVLKSVLEG